MAELSNPGRDEGNYSEDGERQSPHENALLAPERPSETHL